MNCYVLIGGRSQRMGRSKAAMFLPGIAAAARPVFDRIIAVQRRGGELASIETIFESEHKGEAPIFGLAAALEHALAPCFVLATDYPHLTADALAFLRAEFERSSAAVVAPVWDGIVQPLCTGYRPEVRAAVQHRLGAGRLDLRGLLDAGGAEVVAEETIRTRFGSKVLVNVNTPDDLAQGERLE